MSAASAADVIFERLRVEFAGEQVRRLPIEDLARAANLSMNALRRRLHLNGSRFSELHANGLDWAQADEYAVRVGRHPLEVWGDDWEAA